MRRHSFFFNNYMAHFLLILFAFLAAGGAFYFMLSQYVISEKQSELRTTAASVADQTSLMVGSETAELQALYQLSIVRTASENEVTIFVTDTTGVVQFIAQPDGSYSEMPDLSVTPAAVRQVRNSGEYATVGGVSFMSETSSYAVGTKCVDASGNMTAMVFVATEDRVVAAVIRHITQVLLLILLITLACALIISFIISRLMTRPLAAIAAAAKEFAGGNFSVRVPVDNHCTEIDELAVSFNNMARDLDQLEELTRGFIGNVSHEFKTPMTTIGGFVDGMVDGTIPPDQYDKYLHIIAEETRRLSRMVNRMLDAAKIQSGELLLSPAPFDFSEMTSQIILSFEQKIESRRIEVDCELTDRLIVQGDRDHIFRAVYNLVDNAVKFVNDGGKLTLRAAPEGAFCAFSITNTGSGISEEDLPHIFDRFFKTDRSRSLDKTGAGLGLYIVKNIINLHGGEISVRSDGGETEFAFTLPLAPQQHAPGNVQK